MNKQQDELRASLLIKDIKGMDKRQFKFLIKWLKQVTQELETEDRNIFAKSPRFKLFN